MGRGKIEIKRIENSSNRQVTYSKRRNGIIKKAKEISVLCDAEVSLVIFASSGKMHEYCSASLIQILDKYQKQSGKKLWDAKHENLSNEVDRIKTENDSMQIELRHLKGEDITSLNHKELMALEDALENGLSNIRDRQMEVYKMMKKNDKMLEEENQQLSFLLHQREMNMEARVIENGYHPHPPPHHHQHQHQQQQQQQQQQQDHDQYQEQPSQMPFSFHVHPIHPNLLDRI